MKVKILPGRIRLHKLKQGDCFVVKDKMCQCFGIEECMYLECGGRAAYCLTDAMLVTFDEHLFVTQVIKEDSE